MLDQKIKNSKDFSKIVFYTLEDMFKVYIDRTIRDVYLDINSLISIIYRSQNPNDPEIVSSFGNYLSEFISRCETNKITIHFIYSTDKSKVHFDTYPNWCKDRYERVNFMKTEYVLKVLAILKNLSNNNTNIKLINTRNIHPAYYIWVKESGLSKYNKRGIVISKDMVMMGIPISNLYIHNGRRLIDFKLENNYLKEYPDLNRKLALYYIIIRGEARNEYKGVPGYGEVKSYNYIKENALNLILDKEDTKHILRDQINKFKRLYLLEDGLEYLKENKLDPFIIFK